jgi:hypothetical protein
VTGGQITEVKCYALMLFYGKIFSNDANRYYKDFLRDHFTEVTSFTEATIFTEVTTFTDFLEAVLNKFFRFTRDISQVSPNVT